MPSLSLFSLPSAANNLSLIAGQDIHATAARLGSKQGVLQLSAGGSIARNAGQAQSALATGSHAQSSSWFGSSSTETRNSASAVQAIGTTADGQTVAILAGRDLTVTASSIIAEQSATLIARRNLTIQAASNTSSQTSFKETKESGLLDGSDFGISLGQCEQSLEQQALGTSTAASTFGSIEGNVTLLAGNQYRQAGSDVLAPQGDITIIGQQVNIKEARETSQCTTEQKFKQSGLSISNPVLSAVQAGQQLAQAAGDTGDARMQALAVATAGIKGYKTRWKLDVISRSITRCLESCSLHKKRAVSCGNV